MIVLDASVLIGFLSARDAHHREAMAIFAIPADLLIHTLTLAEALVHGERVGRFDEMATAIAAVGVKEAQRVPAEPRRLARLRVETSLKLPDCCVLSLAEAHEADLATFDHRLARVARERGLVVLGASE